MDVLEPMESEIIALAQNLKASAPQGSVGESVQGESDEANQVETDPEAGMDPSSVVASG